MTAESGGMTRREAMKVAGLAGAGLLTTDGLIVGADGGQRVAIVCDPADPVASAAPARWAVGQLRDALSARGVAVRLCSQAGEVAAGDTCVVAGSPRPLRD